MKTTLYLGTSPTHFPAEGHLIHYPVIKVVPRDAHLPEVKRAYDALEEYTHLIFTSKNTVEIFFAHLRELGKDKNLLSGKTIVSIGRVTERHLSLHGIQADLVAQDETQEGIIELLQAQELEKAHIFLPRSSIAREELLVFLKKLNVRFFACDLYDTLPQKLEPIPELANVDEIVFTSPSTVRAFLQIYGRLPRDKKLLAIGPVTEKALSSSF